jgi:putative glutamine amidotransferase
MTEPPLILISPSMEKRGDEFSDPSISLSEMYPRAIMAAGGMPLILPATASPELIAHCVRRCDGVLLTGGEDIEPDLHRDVVEEPLRRTVTTTPDGGERTLRELLVIDEVFRQRKPLLAICRGHQLLNVALGGTLFVDLPTERPGPINHRRMDKRSEVVHEVQLTPDSLLAKITGGQKLGVNSTHHQAVERIAGPLEPAGVSDDGVVESLQLKPESADWLPFLLSVQFHPERLMNRYSEHRAIFGLFTHACVMNRKKML